MSGTNTNNDVIIAEATAAKLTKLNRDDINPDEKREQEDEWASRLEEMKQLETELASMPPPPNNTESKDDAWSSEKHIAFAPINELFNQQETTIRQRNAELAALQISVSELEAAIDKRNTAHEEEIKNVRSELKTKTDEAATLQASNTRLDLHNKELQQEIDQKNHTEAVLAARAAGFIFVDNNKNITDNIKRLQDTMTSPGIVNENVTAFIKPMIATLKRDDLSPKVKQMLKKEWVLLFNDYNEGLTNATRMSEQLKSAGIAVQLISGIAEKRAAAVAAIADIEKTDTAVVGR